MKKKNKKPKRPRKQLLYYYGIALIIIILLNTFVLPKMLGQKLIEVDYNSFLNMLENGEVENVQIDEDRIIFTLIDEDDTNVYFTGKILDLDLTDRLLKAGVNFSGVIHEELSPLVEFLIGWLIPIGIFVLLGKFLSKQLSNSFGGQGAMSFGKSNAKIYVKAETGKTFEDVAGQDEAKEALKEVVDFLNNPKKYNDIGAKMPKGVLLVGPPGTGKTLLAKAVAGEAGVPFFSISGSEFVEMFVGMGAARVRDLFKQAQKKAPCIVFIDEIDTIGKKRDGAGYGGNDEREQTLNQLLAEMDGFDGSKGVIILAATNRPEILDKALLRPGRFDRRIPVELPDLQGREAILKVHAKDVKIDRSVNYNAIARATSGASGADLANIINEAAILAVKKGRKIVMQEDLEEAVETVIAGQQRKNKVIAMKDKLIIAYHEVGHALVAAKLKHSSPVHKITIVPRTSGALGYTMQIDEGEKLLMSKDEILAKIATYAGGRAAEEIIFNSITSGASNDIEMATKLARAMVTRLGMTEEFDMMALETVSNKYLGGDPSLMCSESTIAKADQVVLKIIKDAHDKAVNILNENKDKLHQLAKYLLEKETITGEEFMDILEDRVSVDLQITLEDTTK